MFPFLFPELLLMELCLFCDVNSFLMSNDLDVLCCVEVVDLIEFLLSKIQNFKC